MNMIENENDIRIPIKDCIKGRVYKLRSRNLSIGVYDGMEGFIGIREKFGARYLFTEYHYDQGPPYGTVATIIDTGIDLPEDVLLSHELIVAREQQRLVCYNAEVKNWVFVDTGEVAKNIDILYRQPNEELFEFLEDTEKSLE